jgi:hypothetical protein
MDRLGNLFDGNAAVSGYAARNGGRVAASCRGRWITALCADADVLDAFRVANRAVSHALKKRLDFEEPHGRAFQLAFLLLNLPGIADPAAPDRETVDLLFFRDLTGREMEDVE